jgi:hypothetical protein
MGQWQSGFFPFPGPGDNHRPRGSTRRGRWEGRHRPGRPATATPVRRQRPKRDSGLVDVLNPLSGIARPFRRQGELFKPKRLRGRPLPGPRGLAAGPARKNADEPRDEQRRDEASSSSGLLSHAWPLRQENGACLGLTIPSNPFSNTRHTANQGVMPLPICKIISTPRVGKTDAIGEGGQPATILVPGCFMNARALLPKWTGLFLAVLAAAGAVDAARAQYGTVLTGAGPSTVRWPESRTPPR